MARDLTTYQGSYSDEQAKSASWESAVAATDAAAGVLAQAQSDYDAAVAAEASAKAALDQSRGNTQTAYDAVPLP